MRPCSYCATSQRTHSVASAARFRVCLMYSRKIGATSIGHSVINRDWDERCVQAEFKAYSSKCKACVEASRFKMSEQKFSRKISSQKSLRLDTERSERIFFLKIRYSFKKELFFELEDVSESSCETRSLLLSPLTIVGRETCFETTENCSVSKRQRFHPHRRVCAL